MKNTHAISVFIFWSLPAVAFAQGCEYDTQCKGDRICERNICVFPSGNEILQTLPELSVIPRGNGTLTHNDLTPINGARALEPLAPYSHSVSADVKNHLGWCTGDWGVNEGAQEAIRYINVAISSGYPNQVSAVISIVNEVPGIAQNVLKRPPVMDAAKALAVVLPEVAVELALTCQAHNPPVRQLLSANRSMVIAWLQGQL